MIITSGRFKGVPIFAPPGMDVRPTLAKTRQAVFNILRPYINEFPVVDIFSGTGALGFEALSNGASFAYFLDITNGDYIAKNGAKLRLDGSSFRFIKGDYAAGIDILAAQHVKAGIIFADPPYNRGFVKSLLRTKALDGILAPGGIFAAEIHEFEKNEAVESLTGWSIMKAKQYGETWVVLFVKSEA
jgi:16S rRNA (guanine966-N2)-methyltransferase